MEEPGKADSGSFGSPGGGLMHGGVRGGSVVPADLGDGLVLTQRNVQVTDNVPQYMAFEGLGSKPYGVWLWAGYYWLEGLGPLVPPPPLFAHPRSCSWVRWRWDAGLRFNT